MFVLFVDKCGSYLRPVIGDTTDLTDKILILRYRYPMNVYGIRVYSLKDGKDCDKIQAYDWMVNDFLPKIWIEPPY